MELMKRVVGIVVMLLAVAGTAAWATHQFSDVPDDHPQAEDIAYAVEQGWFAGYEDGTFRPDAELIDRHVVAVFRRAFPQGVTRADLATVLRAGDAALAGDDATGTGFDPIWCNNQPDSACWINDFYKRTHEGVEYWVMDYAIAKQCDGTWDITVRLIDEDTVQTYDQTSRKVSGLLPGDILQIIVPNRSGIAASWQESFRCIPDPEPVREPDPGDALWCDYRVCVDEHYTQQRGGVLHFVVELRNQQLCNTYWSVTVYMLDANENQTGEQATFVDVDGRNRNVETTVAVPLWGALPPSYEVDTSCI